MGNYDMALQKAHKEQKPLMVLLVKKECSFCNDVIKDTFMGIPTLFFVSSKTETFLAKPLYGEYIRVKSIENILKEL